MASHKQSFQCFDTVMDDPPLKPPFPHGHCSSTSFRGSSGSTRLEPLEDRGCYLCADHPPAKATSSEASGAYSNPWYHFQTHPQYTDRGTRPEDAPGQAEDHHHQHHHRHSRKMVLVKNSDPSVRRSIILHRRSLRSLSAFIDEVSELMHCLIRKLYTLEGQKIDSVQSLLQCPSVLVCVGREPFHPLLLESFRKNSYDKLPRLNTKSRSSVCSDEKGAKKTVNFGLETKRSVIHPRCDLSNRSPRLSVSSEKLFPNQLNSLPPGQRGYCPHRGENMMDDDIEKRVLVNKDGSLSMEMKVRFRLLHNETLHWSTEVKKSKSAFNESHVVPDDACSLSHGSAESCSEADSISAGEADETYNTKRHQRHFEESHCQHCCARCQEYDIWKNPVPPDQGPVRRIRSSSSSASSRRIVCKKASTDSMHTVSSEEYTEHVVEKATCIQQTFGQQGDTTIEQCTINHCCSLSEVSSVSPKPKNTSSVEDNQVNTQASDNEENSVISSSLPKDQLSVQITQPVEEDERPISVVSASSQILASLKEDQDDDDVDLTRCISGASDTQQEDEESKNAELNPFSASPSKSPVSLVHLSPIPPSKASSSGRSKRSRKFSSSVVDDEEVTSESSASPKACKCVFTKDKATPESSEPNDAIEDIQPKTHMEDAETEERAQSATSTKSLSELSAPNENLNAAEIFGSSGDKIEERSSSAVSIKSNASGKSNKTEVLEQGERVTSAMSVKSQRSDKSRKSNVVEEQHSEIRTSSAMSVKSNTSVRSRVSDTGIDELTILQDNDEDRAVSSKSNISTKSFQSKEPTSAPDGASEEEIEEEASSVKSGTSNKSEIEELTNDEYTEERAPSSISIKSNISARSKMSFELSEFEDQEQGRAPSSISIKSNVSQKSKSDISEVASFQGEEYLNVTDAAVKLNTPEAEATPPVELPEERPPSSSRSNISTRSRTSKNSKTDQDEAQEMEDAQERASSTISINSTRSERSRKSEKTPKSGGEIKERASSVMSVKSNKSKMEEEETENRASSALSVKSEVSTLSKKSNLSDVEQLEERASSAISAKSNVSVRSKRSKMSEMDDGQSSVVYAASHTSETSNECCIAPEETCKSTAKEERASSALSAKSKSSAKSKVSNMAANRTEAENDFRSASAMSSKSNISAKSVVSQLVTEEQAETKDQREERAQSALSFKSNQSGVTVSDGVEVAEERAQSAMSSKSNTSERSTEHVNVPSALAQETEHQTEERAQSALSAKSRISTRSNKSKMSDVLTDDLVDAKDQEEERASSVLSAKSNISVKSKKSNASAKDVNTNDKQKGDRVPSALSDISTKTSISAKSKASNVSKEPDNESEVNAPSISVRSDKSKHSEEEETQNLDRPPSAISVISAATTDGNEIKDEEEIQERASSALSAKSNLSAKSKMSNASASNASVNHKEKGDRVPSALSGRSDISTKTSISAKSKASRISDRQPEEPDNEKSEEKAPSVSISVRSIKSKHSEEEDTQNLDRPPSAISVISAATTDGNEIKDEEEIQERASSALSAKSNISAKSKMSNASASNASVNHKEKGDRVSSALSGRSDISTKTSISAKSKASRVSEIQPQEADDKESEVKAPSVTKSSISVRSNKSKHSEEEKTPNLDRPPSAISISAATPDGNEIKDEEEIQERASSALSAKSNISAKSKKSNASASNASINHKEKGDRVSSALSGKSDISTKTSISAESKASRISDRQPEEPDDEKSEAKAPSVSISVRSIKSKHSEEEVQNQDRPPSAISVISEATLDENEIQERAQSALSAKSKSSVRSRTSKVSEIIIDEQNEQKVKKSPSCRSLKSNVSGRPGPDDPVSVRTESALSSVSNVSERSCKSEVSEQLSNVDQRAPSTVSVASKVSARSKRSNISAIAPEEAENTDTGDVRSSSAMSDKSCASEKSKLSERTAEEDNKAYKVAERTKVAERSAESKVGVDKKTNRSPSKLSVKSNVSTRSKMSKASVGDNHTPTNTVEMEINRNESPVSEHSEVFKLEKSPSPAMLCDDEVPASPLSKKSATSKISSHGTASERVLTPTSTSVSIGIVEDHEADFDEIDGGVVSMNSRTPALSKTEICGKSVQCLSESPAQITNKATPTPEERPKSFTSAKSNVSGKSKSKCSHCDEACPTDLNQDGDDVASNKSSKPKYLKTSSDGQLSANNSVRKCSPTQEIRPSSKNSRISVHTEITDQERSESLDDTHKSQSVCSKCGSTQQKIKTSLSSASAITDSGRSKTTEENPAEMTDRPRSNRSKSSSHLKANSQNNYVEASVVNEGSNNLSTRLTQKAEDSMPGCTLSVTSGNRLSPSPPKSPKKSKKPVILLGGLNDSVLLQTISAPTSREEHTDHLNAAAERPQSCRSDTNVSDIKSEKSSKCRKRIGSDSSCHKMDDDMSELSPSFLPNASPTEVVNEWLKKIPSDTALCDLGDELHDNYDSIEPLCTSHVPSGDETEHGTLQASDMTKLEPKSEMEDAHVVNAEGETDQKSPEVAEANRSQREDEPKVFDSSVLVMKVLLSPKLDRCNSLPEVSSVYGRKLSASAQGLLDCLANLQLLDFGPSDEDGKKEKYKELMSMLKSLWLCDPKDSEKTSGERSKHLDDELKARSSSGVDVNSGSTGSGKNSVNDSPQAQIYRECDGLDTLAKLQEIDETVEEEASETPESKHDLATPDTASRAQWTPETKSTNEEKLKDDVQGSDETIRNNDSPRELIETPFSSNKSSGNNPKKDETESDHHEDTSSGSAPPLQRGQLSKKLSQDPDPVWILNLLNKLEKQFMTHYVDAMSEFKVRWNLDDNEQLDAMICELQDEVRRRIQTSIDRELQKIQGRVGRPRPPKETMSRESTVQTEQRRRRLKVMRNQSIDPQPAQSDDDNTLTGTDFSDQRSDDEYCPCDTCLKKKMASKHVLPAEMLNSAPVMMDFDLRKILQIKKSSPADEKIEEVASEPTLSMIEAENVGLEAVKEQDEKEEGDKEILTSSTQEIEEDGEKQEDEEGEEDIASSTFVEDSSENQSNISSHVRKDIDEVGEIDNTMTEDKAAEQDEEQENETDSDLMAVKDITNSSKINKELEEDETNGDICEFDDLMQAETSIEEATEEQTEEESDELDKVAEDDIAEKGQTVEEIEATSVDNRQLDEELTAEVADTAEDGDMRNDDSEYECEFVESKTEEEGQNAEAEATENNDGETTEEEGGSKKESAEKSKPSEEEAVEDSEAADIETAEEETTGEDKITENETGDELTEDTAENETAEDVQTSEHEIGETAEGEEGETLEEETAEGGNISEDEIGNESETAEDKTAQDGEIAEDEIGDEGETAKDEIAENVQTADETGDEGETPEDEETAEKETGEDAETSKDETAKNEEISENETGEVEIVKDTTAEEHEMTESETAKEGQSAEDETKEGEPVEDETAEEVETAEDETAEEGDTAEEETADDGQAAAVKTAEESETDENETAEGETAEDETAEDVETAEDKTAEEVETAEEETAEDGQAAAVETAEESETDKNETAEEGETAEDETAEDVETAEDGHAAAEIAEKIEAAEDETAEEGETTENETAEGETAEDETAEDGQAASAETADEGETAEDKTAEEGETTEDKTAEGETTEDETAEEGETAEDKTAEEGETTEDETAEEGETAEDKTAEDDETAGDETAEDGQAATAETTEEGETAEDKTASEGETAEDKSAEDGGNAKRESKENSETADDETVDKGQNTEAESAEDGETAEDKASEDEQTAEAETAEEESEAVSKNESVEDGEAAEGSNTGNNEISEKDETANDDTAEECETAKNRSVENEQCTKDETAEDSDIDDEDTAKESEAAEDETTENGQSAEDDTAREGDMDGEQSAENEQSSEAAADERADVEAIDNEQTAEGSETAEDEPETERDASEEASVEERGTDGQRPDEDETEDNTDVGNADVSAEEKGTSEADTADEGTTEAEEKAFAEYGNAELTKPVTDPETAGEEADRRQSETVSCEAAEEGDTLSNLEDTESHDVLTNVEVVQDETPFMNNGDVVLDSVDDKDEESGKENDNMESMANKGVADIGESAEAGDEAEDDTEPDIETDEGEHDGNMPTLQPMLQPKQKNDKPNSATLFNVLVKNNSESEDGADADGEDSDPEEHNQVIDMTSESESKPRKKTAHTTFKLLFHTLTFIKGAGAGLPKRRGEDDKHEDEETPEDGSDDAEESSCVEKDCCEVEELNGKEKGKLSDITEDTAEGETYETNDGSEDSESESSENALQKQMTKSSLESQPGSFEEVHEIQKKSSNNLNSRTIP